MCIHRYAHIHMYANLYTYIHIDIYIYRHIYPSIYLFIHPSISATWFRLLGRNSPYWDRGAWHWILSRVADESLELPRLGRGPSLD